MAESSRRGSSVTNSFSPTVSTSSVNCAICPTFSSTVICASRASTSGIRSTPSVAPCSRGPEQADNNRVTAHPPKIQNFFIFKLFYRCEKIPSTAPKDKVQTSVDRHSAPHINLIRHPLFFTHPPAHAPWPPSSCRHRHWPQRQLQPAGQHHRPTNLPSPAQNPPAPQWQRQRPLPANPSPP